MNHERIQEMKENNKFSYVLPFVTAMMLFGMIAVILITSLTSCNKQIIDTNYTFNRAIINTGNEVIEVKVKSWTDYEDGDQIQIKAEDGTVYLVHSSNITLICEDN